MLGRKDEERARKSDESESTRKNGKNARGKEGV